MSKKPKIAVWYNLPSGGAKRALYYHVTGLVARGYDVEIWRPPVEETSYLDLSKVAPEHVIPLRATSEGGGSYLARIRSFARHTHDRIEAMRDHSKACAQAMREAGADLLFANTCMIFSCPYVGRYFDGPKVAYVQEPNRQLYEAMPRNGWRALPPFPAGTPFAVKARHRGRDYFAVEGRRKQADEEALSAEAYDELLCNSYFSRESFLRAYNKPATVCYLGIDTRLFTPRELPREPFVVGVGHIAPPKNVEFVIDAVGEVPERIRPALRWIGNKGDPAYMETLRQRAEARGVTLDLRVMVTDEELIDSFNRAAACLYAPRLEPFGYTPLEANACGTPVVGVREGGLRETVEDGVNGRCVDPEPIHMAEALAELLEDPEEARRLGRQGRDVVETKWSLESSIDRLEARLKLHLPGNA